MADTLRDSFGHDEEIGALFEAYDRLVRWEEHNSRLDAVDPIIERAHARGRIVAFIANTAYRAALAAPEPQDVDAKVETLVDALMMVTDGPVGSYALSVDEGREYARKALTAVGIPLPAWRLAQPEGGSDAE